MTESSPSPEVQAPAADGNGDDVREHRRWRTSLSVIVGILACITLLASMIGIWTYRTVFNTDAWVARVGDLPTNPQVADALATKVTDELFASAGVEQRVAGALPEKAAPIAAPVTNATKSLAYNTVYRIVQSDQFHDLWIAANRAAHQRLVAVLKGEQTGRFATDDGTVALNLLPLFSKALSALHDVAPDLVGTGTPPVIDPSTPVDEAQAELSTYLGRAVPSDFGQIVVFQSDQLSAAQSAVHLITRGIVVLIVLTVALFAGAVLLARRRLRATMWLGLGAAATVIVLWALGRALGNQLLGSLKDDKAREGARATVTTVFSSLRAFSLWVIAAAVLVAVVAFLAGESSSAVALRAHAARLFSSGTEPTAPPSTLAIWVHEHATGVRLVGLVAGLVILALVNLTWGSFALTLLAIAIYEVAVSGMARAGTPVAPG